MTPVEFADLVRKGHGRAVLAVDGPVSQEFEAVIISACREDQRHDSQLEDNRSSYLMSLIDRGQLIDKLLPLVVKPIRKSLSDWDRLHRIRMIGQFASRSNSKALEILQGLALNKDSDSWEVLADLGEIEWLTHHVLPTMPLDAKWRVAGWVDDNPKLEADLMRKLQVAINECDEIRHKTQNNANNREPPSFDKVMGAIQSGARFVPGATQIRDSLSKDQISQVASLWLDEQDFRKANNYLRMIARQIFPLPIQEIIDRVNQGNQPWRFEEIVSECSHNLVREFGLALIAKPEPDYRGFLCLLKSYRPNDLPKMVECLDRFLNLDSDDIHRLCIDLRNLVKEMSPQQRIPFMIWTYEHSPCSACRGWGAEILIKDGTLPESYRQEMLVDADSYARELASKMPI